MWLSDNDFMNVALYLNYPKSVDSSRCRWSYATRDQWHALYYLTLQPRLFPPRRHAMNASRELGSAPIYDSYSPTYDSSHGPQEGERDAPRTLVTLHLPTSSSGTGKPMHRISSERIKAPTKYSN